jgi:hypothetical protein
MRGQCVRNLVRDRGAWTSRTARSLDEVREHLEKALAATAPALVYVRLALVKDDESRGE